MPPPRRGSSSSSSRSSPATTSAAGCSPLLLSQKMILLGTLLRLRMRMLRKLEYFYRFAIVVVGRPIVLVTFELIQTFLHTSEWKKRYATLITFAQRAELYSKMMSQSLE
ncbi:uncharacterized protein LOC121977135 [Zingiber officinale]|uniref:uncharacterized protein LOC121977135 n=1 Tax=Zingiber officinale TaxID=94328 RepID=UPI001C4BB78B|nr:uncharacterized protein LOC121977135 [Zingiber officinale]